MEDLILVAEVDNLLVAINELVEGCRSRSVWVGLEVIRAVGPGDVPLSDLS